jgi:hypothetical protein
VTCSMSLGHFNAAVTRAAYCVLRRLSARASKLPIKSGRSIVATTLIAPSSRGSQDRARKRQSTLLHCIKRLNPRYVPVATIQSP